MPATYILKRGCRDATYDEFVSHFRRLETTAAAGLSSAAAELAGGGDDLDAAAAAAGATGDAAPAAAPPSGTAVPSSKRRKKPAVAKSNVWILKPGRNTNRGTGIRVVDTVEEVAAVLRLPSASAVTDPAASSDGSDSEGGPGGGGGGGGRGGGGGAEEEEEAEHEVDEQEEGDDDDGTAANLTAAAAAAGSASKRAAPASGRSRVQEWIVQKYLERPLLVDNRKFDIRVFVLLTATERGKCLEGYIYKVGAAFAACGGARGAGGAGDLPPSSRRRAVPHNMPFATLPSGRITTSARRRAPTRCPT